MFIVYDKEMNVIPFPDGVKPLDIFISSIEKERTLDRAEGSNRRINYGSIYTEREIELKILMKVHDTQDYRLLRNAVYAMFQTGDELYVSEKYERGKRYLISVDQRFVPERYNNNQRFAEATIVCSMPELPFSESIGTTQDIERNGIDANSALWGFGMGLIADDESLRYTHAKTSFRIYNAGNVPVHPFEQELKIIIKNAFNSTEFLQLKNLTNGTVFKLNEGLPLGKELVLDGPIITIDGLNALRRTNRQFLELEPGWNEFELTGVSSARVEFDFRFYYK